VSPFKRKKKKGKKPKGEAGGLIDFGGKRKKKKDVFPWKKKGLPQRNAREKRAGVKGEGREKGGDSPHMTSGEEKKGANQVGPKEKKEISTFSGGGKKKIRPSK